MPACRRGRAILAAGGSSCSLDAQREAVEAYIASQKAEGWVCLPDRYDDGGFTGGNMERPGFQRLMAAIDGGKIDCVVVYTAAGSRQESCGHCYG